MVPGLRLSRTMCMPTQVVWWDGRWWVGFEADGGLSRAAVMMSVLSAALNAVFNAVSGSPGCFVSLACFACQLACSRLLSLMIYRNMTHQVNCDQPRLR